MSGGPAYTITRLCLVCSVGKEREGRGREGGFECVFSVA